MAFDGVKNYSCHHEPDHLTNHLLKDRINQNTSEYSQQMNVSGLIFPERTGL